MKILYLTSCLAIGGTEIYTLDYAECMLRRGHAVFWGTVKDGAMKALAIEKGVNMCHCSFEKRTPIHALRAISDIRKVVKQNGIDIVHATDAYTAMLAAIALKKRRPPVRLIWSNVGIGSKTYRRMLKTCGNDFDLIIAVSNFIRNRMIEEGFSPDDIVVYSQTRKMADAKKTRVDIRREFNLNDDEVVIGTVGRVVKLKGNQTVIEAMPRILKECPNVKMIIVGDGPQRAEQEQKCKELGIKDKVIFTGFRTDIENVYTAFDIVAFPTYYEALGYIPYEAMYYKKPIIASLTGGVPELVIDGYNGILVPPAVVDKWVDGIIKLVKDKHFAEMLVKNGSEFYKSHLVREDEAEVVEKLYLSAEKGKHYETL